MPFWVFPSQVRTQVLALHAELRSLLARAIADATTDGFEADSHRLTMTARELATRFRTHLAFEDDELSRVFAALDAWGPERVRDLHAEHRRQRRELDELMASFESGAETDLALALRSLAEKLSRDMEDEEAGCLQSPLMRADSIPFERH
jgi:hypothetical protein